MIEECGPAGTAAMVWIVDTGSGNHLSSWGQLPEGVAQFVRDNPERVRLSTANGIVDAKAVLDLYVPDMKVKARALILDNCPSVLSVGRMVEDEMFEFHWLPGRAWFRDRAGRDHECTVQNYVPVLSAKADLQDECALPGVEESPDAANEADDGGDQADAGQYEPADPPASNEEEDVCHPCAGSEERLRKVAASPEHCMTHLPKNPFCDVCAEGKSRSKPARRRQPKIDAEPEEWGDTLLADHYAVSELGIGLDGERYGILLKDVGSGVVDTYAVRRKSKVLTVCAIREFGGSKQWQRFASDNAPELIAAAKAEYMTHVTSTPWRPQSNSLIEREVGILCDGVRCLLAQSGLPHGWWPYAARAFCHARNVSVPHHGGPTPWEKKFGEPFGGQLFPFLDAR